MEGCIFCKIVEGKIPSKKVYEDEHVLAFYDLTPQAPVHVLLIPKAHITGIHDVHLLKDAQLIQLMHSVALVANQLSIDKSGYRVVTNWGKDACQSVEHLHFHLLGGGQLNAQMG